MATKKVKAIVSVTGFTSSLIRVIADKLNHANTEQLEKGEQPLHMQFKSIEVGSLSIADQQAIIDGMAKKLKGANSNYIQTYANLVSKPLKEKERYNVIVLFNGQELPVSTVWNSPFPIDSEGNMLWDDSTVYKMRFGKYGRLECWIEQPVETKDTTPITAEQLTGVEA